jgi:hypothetical protein
MAICGLERTTWRETAINDSKDECIPERLKGKVKRAIDEDIIVVGHDKACSITFFSGINHGANYLPDFLSGQGTDRSRKRQFLHDALNFIATRRCSLRSTDSALA